MYDVVVGLFIVWLLFVLFRLVGDMIFDNNGKADNVGCTCDSEREEDSDEVISGSASASRLVRRSATGHVTHPASDLDAPPAAALAGVRTPPKWLSMTGPYAAPVAVASSIVVLLFS
ncbi:hypothetical protein [Nocardioides sp.]|uniref:hypothetical protein n=1 Tax=Nocardioides sp. TaxID=35761 RepID=UPI002C0194C1|nr:hypothetical protein [Nocardioides sp.]HXH80988.1 hypothetical protein [Nocardioides sp.]